MEKLIKPFALRPRQWYNLTRLQKRCYLANIAVNDPSFLLPHQYEEKSIFNAMLPVYERQKPAHRLSEFIHQYFDRALYHTRFVTPIHAKMHYTLYGFSVEISVMFFITCWRMEFDYQIQKSNEIPWLIHKDCNFKAGEQDMLGALVNFRVVMDYIHREVEDKYFTEMGYKTAEAPLQFE